MPARLRIIGGKGMDVAVTQLAIDGCCVIKPDVMLRAGQRVSIKLESLDHVTGVVMQSSEADAEIQFDRPLYGPVVEHLRQRFFR